jgi:hypoxanthine-guanine phosphoribosyltransferase
VLFADRILHKILIDTKVEFAITTAAYKQKTSSTGKTTMHDLRALTDWSVVFGGIIQG